MVIRWLASPMLTSSIVERIGLVIPLLGEKFATYWDSEFRQKKSHEFFVHLYEELQYGTPYDFTSAPFENLNKHLKSLMDPKDTRSMDSNLLKMFIIRRQWEEDAREAMKTSTPEFVNFCKSFNVDDSKKKIKYRTPPKADQSSDNSYIIFQFEGARTFGRIIDIEDDNYFIQIIYGVGIAEFFSSYTKADPPVHEATFQFIPHGEFIICLTGEEETDLLMISRDQIISHCCLLTSKNHHYLVSLEYRGPNK